MSKHTPGPWQASRWRVCSVNPFKWICDTATNNKHRTPEAAANAQLIAAAPSLLNACKVAEVFCADTLEDFDLPSEVMTALRRVYDVAHSAIKFATEDAAVNDQIANGGPASGLGLRDYFAANASDPPIEWMKLVCNIEEPYTVGGREICKHIARWKYMQADAMLAARSVEPAQRAEATP